MHALLKVMKPEAVSPDFAADFAGVLVGFAQTHTCKICCKVWNNCVKD
jgi:hypothetical protein